MPTSLTKGIALARIGWKTEFADPDDTDGALKPVEDRNLGVQTNFTIGTGNNAANRMYRDVLSLAPAAAAIVNFAAALTDHFGESFTFTSIKAILVRNRSLVDGNEVGLTGALADDIFGAATTADKDVFGGGQVLVSRPQAGITPASLTLTADAANTVAIEVELAVLGVV